MYSHLIRRYNDQSIRDISTDRRYGKLEFTIGTLTNDYR